MDMRDNSLCFFDNGNKYPYLVRRCRISVDSLPQGIQINLSSRSINKLDTFLHPKKRVPVLSDFENTSPRRKDKKQLGTIKEVGVTGVKKLGKNKKLQKLIEQAGLDDSRIPDEDIDDDTRFLFEEAKFSATHVILQLGKLLDVVVGLRKDNPQTVSPFLDKSDSSIVLRQGSTDIVWKFDTSSDLNPSISRHSSETGFYPSDSIVDLLSISYVDLIKNTQYKQREWQTHTYKHAVDSTVKGTDSGIFSVPQTAMSGIYVKSDENNNLKPTTKKQCLKSEGSVLNANVSKQTGRKQGVAGAPDEILKVKEGTRRKSTRQKTRIERYSVVAKDGMNF